METMFRLPVEDLDHVLAHTGAVWEKLRGQTLFITGGTGFVGLWLAESLLWANDRLDANIRVVMLSRDPTRFSVQMPQVAGHGSVRMLPGRAESFAFPEGEFPLVIHAATAAHHPPTPECPVSAFDADLLATRRVLEFARTHGARRVLFTSSGAVYGQQPPGLPAIAEDFAGAPLTTDTATSYGQAKRISEFLCAAYARQCGFAALIARLFTFVGPRLPLNAHYAVGNFIRDALRGGPVRIAGDGTAQRSYLYAADMAIWLWTILACGSPARPYNVGSPQALTIRELAQTVVEVICPGAAIEIAGQPGVSRSHYLPSTHRAEAELGLRARTALPEALQRTCAWHRRCGTTGEA
jgi:dTDP-glucose 4,6-dehydratase